MLQEQSRFFQRLMFAVDLGLVLVAWSLAYHLRFNVLTPPEYRPFSDYAWLLPWVVSISALVFWASGLYSADRAQRLHDLLVVVAKAVAAELVFVAATLSFYRDFSFSRLMLIFFGVLTPVFMVGVRVAFYAYVRRARRLGRYVKSVLIVGAGRLGRRLEEAFHQFPWMGLEVVGFLDDHKTGEDILGTAADTARVVDRFNREGRPLDYVYIAMPPKASDRIEMIVDELSSRLVHVCLVPDLFQFNILNSRITHMAGMPVVHVIDEAPLKLGVVLKRLFDVFFSVAVLLILSPLLIVLAIAVKLSSKGPVFYHQTRMGLNGQMFQMLKFRSMPVNAEEQSGPIWASKEDRRATPVGAFMRKTSLDELPQFINVLKGDMSVVGPRPERPVFIDEFKDRVPGYMLRHKTRAGITGWAQVNGWRGNTSIEKRIEYDLFYIQNWSLGLDLRIILMTLWTGLRDENAY